MIKIDHFNSLPPRPADITAIERALRHGENLKLNEIISKTKLTKTQALCSLQYLININKVRVLSTSKAKLYTLQIESSKI